MLIFFVIIIIKLLLWLSIPPPHPPASYILVSKMKQILCSTDWWLEWAILPLILRFVSARKKLI